VAISDAGFAYLQQMIEYKEKFGNFTVVIANHFFLTVKPVFVAEKLKKV
jgi:putative transposase